MFPNENYTLVFRFKTTKKAPNYFGAFAFWVADRVRTGDPRHHKPIL